MGVLDALRAIDPRRAWLIVIAFIPYVDQETLGVIPGLRDLIPFVDPIYVTELDWSERARLLGFIVVPYVDGEILELLGVDMMTLIED
jgi:hypothetical protein